ncbi:transposase [Streptomyces sp. NPDC056501]|uniref:transposase n=1 Tax=Streptomyces sp. NPDC056501 TaxID=3345841 RepID=UPI00368F7E09
MPVPGWPEGRGGQPESYCHRQMIDAIRCLMDNGIKWRAMPVDFPPGTRSTCSWLVSSSAQVRISPAKLVGGKHCPRQGEHRSHMRIAVRVHSQHRLPHRGATVGLRSRRRTGHARSPSSPTACRVAGTGPRRAVRIVRTPQQSAGPYRDTPPADPVPTTHHPHPSADTVTPGHLAAGGHRAEGGTAGGPARHRLTRPRSATPPRKPRRSLITTRVAADRRAPRHRGARR